MSKSFTTVKLLKGKEPLLRRLACEIRYQDGQLYLDRTGRLLKKLLRDPAWVVTPDPSPQGTTAFHMVDGLHLAFSMNSAALDLDRSNADELIDSDEAARFVSRADETLGFIADELEVTEFERLGFRQWYYFSFDKMEETESWIRELGLFPFPASLLESFEANPKATGVSYVMEGTDCNYRIAVNGIERSAQLPIGDANLNIRASSISQKIEPALKAALIKKRQKQIDSAFSAVLDVDTYRKEPKELNLSVFLGDALKQTLERFRNSLPKEKGQ